MTSTPAASPDPAAARELRAERVVAAPVGAGRSTPGSTVAVPWSPLLLGGTGAHADELEAGMARSVARLGAAASAVGEQGGITRGSEPGAG